MGLGRARIGGVLKGGLVSKSSTDRLKNETNKVAMSNNWFFVSCGMLKLAKFKSRQAGFVETLSIEWPRRSSA
jgi:hypothetical protein